MKIDRAFLIKRPGRCVFTFVVVEQPQSLETRDETAAIAQLSELLFTLAKKGYRIAVSDSLSPDSLETLGNVAHIIKLDILRYMPDVLERRIRELRNFDAKLLAEHVDSYDEMEYSKSLGFDLYQGGLLCKPAAGKNLRSSWKSGRRRAGRSPRRVSPPPRTRQFLEAEHRAGQAAAAASLPR